MNKPVGNGENVVTVGQFIRTLREKKAMSRHHLARLCQVSEVYLRRVEDGRRPPSRRLLTAIAHHLHFDEDVLQLMGGHVPFDVVELLREQPGLCRQIRRLAGQS